MVETARSVAAFFRECLLDVLKAHRLQPSELAESYLVQLLTELASPQHVPRGPDTRTLVEMLGAAQAAQGSEKARRYRELGDSALLWSGVFRERLLHRGMSLTYYESVGGNAYRQAGYLHRLLRASPIDELCLELSANFADLSDALDEAATLGLEPGDKGVVNLLGRFHRSRRPWMKEQLLQWGVDPEEPRN